MEPPPTFELHDIRHEVCFLYTYMKEWNHTHQEEVYVKTDEAIAREARTRLAPECYVEVWCGKSAYHMRMCILTEWASTTSWFLESQLNGEKPNIREMSRRAVGISGNYSLNNAVVVMDKESPFKALTVLSGFDCGQPTSARRMIYITSKTLLNRLSNEEVQEWRSLLTRADKIVYWREHKCSTEKCFRA